MSHRIDLNGATSQDIFPRFSIQHAAPLDLTEPTPQPKVILLATTLFEAFPTGGPIFQLINGIAVLAAKLNGQLNTQSNNIFQNCEWPWDNIYPLAHGLMSYRPSVVLTDQGSIVTEFCRLSLCLFLTNARAKFTAATFVLDIYVEKLRTLLPYVVNIARNWPEFDGFRVWALTMAAMAASGEARVEILNLLKDSVESLGILTHDALEFHMREFIWIENTDSIRFLNLQHELWDGRGIIGRGEFILIYTI